MFKKIGEIAIFTTVHAETLSRILWELGPLVILHLYISMSRYRLLNSND